MKSESLKWLQIRLSATAFAGRTTLDVEDATTANQCDEENHEDKKE